MRVEASHLEEAALVFGGEQPGPDPKVGLSLFGPLSASPKQIRLGIIGDADTVDKVQRLLAICRSRVEGPTRHPLWTQDFPGLNSSSPLSCELVLKPEWGRTLAKRSVDELDFVPGLNQRIRRSVELFCTEIRSLKEREEAPTVFVCAPPRRMMDLCLPAEGDARGGRGRSARVERGKKWTPKSDPHQMSLAAFDPEMKQAEDEFLQRVAGDNFHHFLKAKAMEIPAPTQFVRPYTLDKLFGDQKGKVQDRATIAWNLYVGLFYKAEGRPWKLRDMPSNACFVGISFYQEKPEFGGGIGTSLAQVFTPDGSGLVLRGERITWPKGEEPHLSRSAAKRLMERILKAYEGQSGTAPGRVVIHKSSSYSLEERFGFKEGLGSTPKHDFVTLVEHSKRVKLFRAGAEPPIRGTLVTLPDDSRLLFTRGYVPLFRVYPGARVPRPLEISFDEVSTPKTDLCREILGLTRMNWNTADFAGMEPITLQFSREVGRILREVPPGVTPETRYLYYM
jgi:hypothetical protein